MLSSVRGALKNVVVWFVLALLVLAFAAFGVPEISNFTQQPAIKVGDRSITAQQVVTEFDRVVRSQQIQSEGNFTRQDAIEAGFVNQIVGGLSTRAVIGLEAEKMNLAMPRSLVKDILSSDERFQNPETGEFDLQVLTNLLQQYNYTVRQFEAEIRDDLTRGQLIDSLEGGGPASKTLINSLLLRSAEKRDVEYLTVREDMAGIPEEPSPDKLRSFYEANLRSHTSPEFRTFTVVSLRNENFSEGLEASEENLRKLYEIQKPRLYDKPERRTIYQAPFDTETEAQAAAAALAQGKTFDEVATERGLTIDAVTYTDITKSDIVDPDVAEAAFSADLGERAVSAPVKGLFGWTIIQVVSITAPETKSFEEVRGDLQSQYAEQDAQRRIYDAIDAIEDARDTGADIVEAGENAGAGVSKFGPVDSVSFAPGGAIIDDIPGEVLREAFDLSEGEESDAVKYADGNGWFFVVINEVAEPIVAPYEDVADKVEAAWRADEKTRRISRAVKQVRDALGAGANLAEAATPFNTEPETTTVTRAADAFSPALVTQIFAADINAAVSGPGAIADEQVVVVVTSADFDRAQINPAVTAMVGQNFAAQLDQELLDAYVQALRADYGVRIDQSQIDTLFNAN